MPCLAEICHEAVVLEKKGEVDKALDVLFAGVDDMAGTGAVQELNDGYAEVDIHEMGTNLLVGLLSITRAVTRILRREGKEMPNWPALVERVRERLTVLAPDRVEKLMSGLGSLGD